MRALILADIHSNIWALEAVFRQEKDRFDAVYCAGDLVDYGPEPVKAIEFCRDNGIVCVLGNHDEGLLQTTQDEVEDMRKSRHMAWKHDNYEMMTEETWAYLRALPEVLNFDMDGIHYQMQHRMENSYETPVFRAQFEAMWQGKRDDGYRRLILGHTHRPCVYRMDNDYDWINPGSVSYRNKKFDDGDRRAHYMIVDNGDVLFRCADYDHAPLMRALDERFNRREMDRKQVETGRYLFSRVYETYAEALAEADRLYREIEEGRF